MTLNFEKLGGIVPVIIQDYNTSRVIMLGFMNAEAIEKSKSSGKVMLYSRSKNRILTKGEESGNLDIIEMKEDCNYESILIKAIPHDNESDSEKKTYFNENNSGGVVFLEILQNLIEKRKLEMPENSYTSTLFKSGINKIAQKVGEEAVELVIESKDNNDELFLNEAADLLFHMMVLFASRNYRIEDVVNILQKRHK
jgi:phosphoribosyl-AMP cyclohydrolase / phosphoribosyl-ATP pyrophosphohydrolase